MKVAYPKYKPTDIYWLTEVPEHWYLFPITAITTPKSKKGRGDLPLLSVYREYGVILKSSRDDNHNRDGEDLSNYKIVEPENLVINKMKTWQGSLGVSDYSGIVSPAYIVCVISKTVHGKFLHYLLRSSHYIYQYNRLSYGIRNDQWDMHYEDFKRLPVFLPPVEEQVSIAKYLDAKSERVIEFIDTKNKLISLLKEQRDAIICDAVTKGIDENAELKSTGLNWLSEIPSHWETLPFFAAFKEKYIKNDKQKEYDVLSLSYGTIVKRKLDDNFGLLPESFDTYQMVNPGDYIFRLTDMQNDHKSLRVGLSKLNGIITSAYLNVRARISIDEDFAFYLLHSYDLSKIIYTLGGGVRQSIGFAEMKRIPILIPPIEEQKEIVQYIKAETGRIDDLINRIQKEIELVKEYKKSLISEVVTGKIKVA